MLLRETLIFTIGTSQKGIPLNNILGVSSFGNISLRLKHMRVSKSNFLKPQSKPLGYFNKELLTSLSKYIQGDIMVKPDQTLVIIFNYKIVNLNEM